MCLNIYILQDLDSKIDGMGVYESRVNAGRILAKTHPVEADLVVGVPESGNPAALGYSMESGIPYGNAFIKNNYVGRTFIKPKQEQRESSVKVKLNVLKEKYVAGKRVVMIDDSIVRGTTSRRIVNLLRQAGAKEVHVRISSSSLPSSLLFWYRYTIRGSACSIRKNS